MLVYFRFSKDLDDLQEALKTFCRLTGWGGAFGEGVGLITSGLRLTQHLRKKNPTSSQAWRLSVMRCYLELLYLLRA